MISVNKEALCHIGLAKDRGGHLVNQPRDNQPTTTTKGAMVRAEAIIITLTVDIHTIDVSARLLHYDGAARVTHLAFYSNCGTPGGHLDKTARMPVFQKSCG